MEPCETLSSSFTMTANVHAREGGEGEGEEEEFIQNRARARRDS